jgi:hypothetical protein
MLSLQDIAIHFHIDEETALGLLEMLIKKDKIKKLTADCSGCSTSCKNCPTFSKTLLFSWKE